jgi:hypothetical protein
VSIACAVHCFAAPVVMAALVLLGVRGGDAPELEWVFLGASMIIGVVAFRTGQRVHGRRGPLRLFVLGLSTLLLARVLAEGSSAERVCVAIGAAAVVWAHIANLRLRSCPSSSAVMLGGATAPPRAAEAAPAAADRRRV